MSSRSLSILSLIYFCAIYAINPCLAQNKTCILKGTTVDRDSKNVYLLKCTEGVNGEKLSIPIRDNKFQYEFPVKSLEAYRLIFQDELDKSTFYPIVFFPDTNEVQFVLYDLDNADKMNVVKGGKLNKQYQQFKVELSTIFKVESENIRRRRDSLNKKDSYYSDARKKLISMTKSDDINSKLILVEIDELSKTGKDLTPEGNLVRIEQNKLTLKQNNWKYQYIKSNPSIASYFLIWNDVYYAKTKPQIASLIEEVYPSFAKRFPNHVYTARIAVDMNGFNSIRPGGRYIDFTAPTLKGEPTSLADVIRDKVTLIDLWGSWCAPCIAKTRTMVPIYEKYKDKGFNIVGVAREYRNTEAVKSRLNKEKFDWTHLIELDDKNNIWNKYGISNGAGLMVLVDKTGTILAVDPTAEQVEGFLKKLL